MTDNLTLRSVDGLRQIWFNLAATPQYYPLVHISFWLEYHLWGPNPLGYHLVNVSLQALAAILLWRVLVRLQLPGAWFAAGIFALHPAMALFQKGRSEAAIIHFRRAVAIKPDFAEAQNNLGIALFQKGKIVEAIIHLQRVLAIQPGFTSAQEYLTRAAWALATPPNPSIRNGTKAVELARETDRLSGGKNPVMAATLAAAYAEAERFPETIATMQRALQLATSQNISALVVPFEAQLKLYQSGLPCRDAAAPQ